MKPCKISAQSDNQQENDENNKCLKKLNVLKVCEVSRILISNWTWKFQLFILKNKKVLSLKKYDLSRSLYIDQDSSNRWRFAVPIFKEDFGSDIPRIFMTRRPLFKRHSIQNSDSEPGWLDQEDWLCLKNASRYEPSCYHHLTEVFDITVLSKILFPFP